MISTIVHEAKPLAGHAALASPPGRGQYRFGGNMKPALMIIDMQKAYHTGASAQSMDAACEYINAAAVLFRRKGLPVPCILNKDEYDKALPGLPGFELIETLKPLENEPRITKAYGYRAEYCVLSTYRGAMDLDLVSVILRGGVASGVEQNIGFVERISGLISCGALKAALSYRGCEEHHPRSFTPKPCPISTANSELTRNACPSP